MQKGVIKWFSPDKGYGFVKSGEDEIFLHYSAAPKENWNDLAEGKYIAFHPVQGRRVRQAAQVRLISEEEAKDDRGDIPEASDDSRPDEPDTAKNDTSDDSDSNNQ